MILERFIVESAHLTFKLSFIFSETLFDLPKDDALDECYRTLGVEHSSSNGEITKAYRTLSLKNHPDKGGNKETFLKINAAVEVIRAARDMS